MSVVFAAWHSIIGTAHIESDSSVGQELYPVNEKLFWRVSLNCGNCGLQVERTLLKIEVGKTPNMALSQYMATLHPCHPDNLSGELTCAARRAGLPDQGKTAPVTIPKNGSKRT